MLASVLPTARRRPRAERLCAYHYLGAPLTAPGCVFSLRRPYSASHGSWSDPMAPIHDAARECDAETIRQLLAEGVSPDITGGHFSKTPLHVLCSNNNAADDRRVACIKLLIEAGANLEAPNYVGSPALHHAALNGDATIMSLLVKAGANVNAADRHGYTALHDAAFKSADCVEVLLAAGASVNARSNSGRRPFDFALSQNYRRVWPLFLRAGAEIPTDNTDRYIVRVRNAGGFQRYAQQHIARIASILETPLLPPGSLQSDYFALGLGTTKGRSRRRGTIDRPEVHAAGDARAARGRQ